MPTSHSELRALVEQALELESAQERETLLAGWPDPALAAEARALLGLAARAAVLDRGAIGLAQRAETPELPERIGPYRVVGLLGSGGMGAVYHGVRDDGSFRKDVAIKVVRDVYSVEQRQRFERERELLARLEHPGIARVLDGGSTAGGQSWMAIERVVGLPLDEYVRAHGLGLRQRIELLLGVHAAVQFAHQNLIVHRDLKPANVLVDADGRPRLLDFGVAKLLGEVDHTQTAGRAPMTFAYAAPEQVRGEAITTATDVYALGVMLYELLTGDRPHKPRGENPLSLLQAITDTDATAPSIALAKLSRGTGEGIAATQLRGDLDTICLKALSRDPQRRYASVQAFADDLRAYLESRPISARRDSGSYRLGKWLRRNPMLASSLILLALSVAAGVWFSYRYARAANQEAERALAQLRATDALSQVLTGMFADASPYRSSRAGVTVENLLRLASQRAQTELQGEPDLRLNVQSDLALAVHFAVDSEQGLAQLKDLWGQAERDPTVAPEVRLRALLNLISAYDNAAKTGDSAELRPKVAAFRPEPEAGTLLWYRRQRALLDTTDYSADSIAALREFARQAGGFRESWKWETQAMVARYLRRAGRFDESDPLHEQLIAHYRASGERLALASVLRTSVYKAASSRHKVERIQEALDITVAELGADHPDTLLTRMNLIEARLATGEVDQVDGEFLALIEQQRRYRSEVTVATLVNYVRYLIDRRDFRRAAPFTKEALALAPGLKLNKDAPMALAPRLYALQVELGLGHLAEVAAELPALIEDARNAPPAYWRMLLLSAELQQRQGAHREALATALQALDALPPRPPEAPPTAHEGRVQCLLGDLHLTLGDRAQARASLERALDVDAAAPEPWVVWPARAQWLLAEALAGEPGQDERGAALREQAIARIARLTPPDDPWRQALMQAGAAAPRQADPR
ncbi:MAG: serine/threonine protein kinase [Rhodanobacteraceae bacterium]|nr:serine/threonine protein kinase [Rhodanobacteraceae bacterium]